MRMCAEDPFNRPACGFDQRIDMLGKRRTGIDHGDACLVIADEIRVCAWASHHAWVGCGEAQHVWCNLDRHTWLNICFCSASALWIDFPDFCVGIIARDEYFRLAVSSCAYARRHQLLWLRLARVVEKVLYGGKTRKAF